MNSDKTFDYSTYLSPFTTRYGSGKMREIWSEKNKRLTWRKVWVALAKAEYKAGLVNKRELDDIISHQTDVDIAKSKEKEKEVYHELMSEIQVFAQQCKIGGGKIHLGATSADILDNATILQTHQAIQLVKAGLIKILRKLTEKIKNNENLICMGYTHLQPAEPTTLGYRFAFYAQDFLTDLEFLKKIEPFIKTKGIKGAVGTSASYANLLENSTTTPLQLEKEVMADLELTAVDVSNQTYPRKIDLLVIETLANIASSIHKFCFDYRVMQSPLFGEWMEKRNPKRVGSSAMPFKRNPDRAEKVCSLCRYISSLLPLAWSNPANSLLERTLDDSASQRIFLPEAFLALDDCLNNTMILLDSLEINYPAVKKNLETFGQFSATEPLLMTLVRKGANRQDIHEVIKNCSMEVWRRQSEGKNTSLTTLLLENKTITSFISKKELEHAMTSFTHIGMAKAYTHNFLKKNSTI